MSDKTEPERLLPEGHRVAPADAATLPNPSPLTRSIPGAAGRLGMCVGRLARGPGDPTHRRVGQGWWRASNTPCGPALLSLADDGADVAARAWGAGAEWALEQLPRLLGCHDQLDFRPHHPLLKELLRRHPQLRVGATGLVCESLLPSVVEQKVTGAEAFRAIHRLTRCHASVAPGPAGVAGHPASGMLLPLTADQWAAIPSWEYLLAGVEQKRSATLVAAARRGRAVERTLTSADADAALRSLPGIGPWTSARARQQAHGDPDAWSVGDYHVGRAISFALCGEQLDDDGCAELLAPYAGQRYRVELLLSLGGPRIERHGPRRSLPTHLP
ncbi:DNA-3-methyladenine glycosylase 2 family protein [Luteococcus sp. H138]|uniref:DNA-3-methyladenine glycosylase family protein n=1 Tax=unclassified Luteococcus TaxID=2639923 RepID=UPI00313B7800